MNNEDNWMIKMHKEAYAQIPNEASESTLNGVLCDLREKVAKIIWLVIKDAECSNQIAYEKADEIIKLCVEKLRT